jgi:hsp70-interacting protein
MFLASEDAPAASSFEAMDPERRRWLEEAIASMTVDVIKQLAECIKLLNDHAVKDPDADEDQLALVQSALDCVTDFVDNMDLVIFILTFVKFILLLRNCIRLKKIR